MVYEHGALKAAKALLASEEPAEGLHKLWELGQLNLSIEAIAINPIYKELFTDDEVKIEKKRLDIFNYQQPIED